MKLDRRFLLGLCLCLGLSVSVAASDGPLKIAGISFERQMRVAGVDLRLNGVGARGWFKAYVAGLYLTAPVANAADAVVLAGPKRLRMRLRFDVPAGEFVKALRQGMTRNVAPPVAEQLAGRIERFAAAVAVLGTVHDGDLIDLDFEPGRGMTFTLNGKLRGDAIDGEDFYGALLRAFIGDHPYDEKLKAGLLGQAP